MRIADRHQVELLLAAVQGLRQNIFDRQEQVTSGKRVNRPSDDPAAAERIAQFKNVIQTTDKRLFAVSEGQSRLNLSEATLGSAGNTIQRAKELAIRLRNDTNSATERTNTAKEVNELFQGIVALANTNFNGRSLFAGFETQTDAYSLDSATSSVGSNNTGDATVSASVVTPSSLQPDLYEIRFTSSTQFDVTDLTTGQVLSTGNSYTSGAAIAFDGLSATVTNGTGPPQTDDTFHVRVGYSYQGDSGSIDVETGDGRSVKTNMAGDQVFSGPTVNILTALQDFHQALATNNTDGLDTAIGQLDTALSQINNARADLGARANRLDTIKEGLELLNLNTETLRSDFEDADLAKVASELATLQTNLEASFATLTRQFETSLLNFLR